MNLASVCIQYTENAVVAMPIPNMDEQATAELIRLMSSDLRFILEECQVRAHVQAVLAYNGVSSLRRMCGFGDTVTEVRAALRTQLGLDADEGLQSRNDVSDVLSAWTDAKAQDERETNMKAYQRVLDQHRPAAKREVKSMRAAFELVHGALKNEVTPGRYYLGTKLEECLEGDPSLEELTDVANKEDGEEDLLVPDIQARADGTLKVRKGQAKKMQLPQNSEHLRARYKVINHAWLFVKMRHRTKAWLDHLAVGSFQALGDYILGGQVAEMESEPRPDGSKVKPSWELVLSCERQVRKRMYELIKEQKLTMVDAMEKAIACSETRSFYCVEKFSQQVSFGNKRKHTEPFPYETQRSHPHQYDKTFSYCWGTIQY